MVKGARVMISLTRILSGQVIASSSARSRPGRFGRLYGLPVYLDSTLAERPEMVFPGGSHHEEVRMPMREYLRIERPIVSVAVTPHAA